MRCLLVGRGGAGSRQLCQPLRSPASPSFRSRASPSGAVPAAGPPFSAMMGSEIQRPVSRARPLRKERPVARQKVSPGRREPPPQPRGGLLVRCGEQPGGTGRLPGRGVLRETCHGPGSPRGVKLPSPPWLPHKNGPQVPCYVRVSHRRKSYRFIERCPFLTPKIVYQKL